MGVVGRLLRKTLRLNYIRQADIRHFYHMMNPADIGFTMKGQLRMRPSLGVVFRMTILDVDHIDIFPR